MKGDGDSSNLALMFVRGKGRVGRKVYLSELETEEGLLEIDEEAAERGAGDLAEGGGGEVVGGVAKWLTAISLAPESRRVAAAGSMRHRLSSTATAPPPQKGREGSRGEVRFAAGSASARHSYLLGLLSFLVHTHSPSSFGLGEGPACCFFCGSPHLTSDGGNGS
jgi:hypothetical protein